MLLLFDMLTLLLLLFDAAAGDWDLKKKNEIKSFFKINKEQIQRDTDTSTKIPTQGLHWL